jgi:uncharacterized peroxidase-related enzyme
VRLEVLDYGHRLRARLFVAVAGRLAGGEDVDDVFKTILYRPALFGGPVWSHLIRSALRGDSEWSTGERELFAAATSQANGCAFCVDVHCQTAGLVLGQEITPDVLADANGSHFRPEVQAMLQLLAKVTAEPEQVTGDDIQTVRDLGVSDEAFADAAAILFIFNVLNRLADAFDFSWKSSEHRRQGAEALVRFGYRVPSVLLR